MMPIPDNPPAHISTIEYDGRVLANVAISEVGRFVVPLSLLRSKPVLVSALDVVDISFGSTDTLTFEAKGDVVTTELLTEDVRLQIDPKVSFDALNLLLQWSSQPLSAIQNQRLSVDFANNVGLYDLYVDRYLRSLEAIESDGWLPSMRRLQIADEELRGTIDPSQTVQRLLEEGGLRLVQTVGNMHFGGDPNKVLVTGLVYVAKARAQVSGDLMRRTQQILGRVPEIEPYPDPKQALHACEAILGNQTIDASRSYYYPALRCCLPILQATSRLQGASRRQEDMPLRIPMPEVFESAVRNITDAALSKRFRVAKGFGKSQYETASHREFNPALEPDITIHPLGRPNDWTAILDVKYKEKPTPGDHYQLAAYRSAYNAPISAFVTVADSHEVEGPRRSGIAADGSTVYEYGIFAGDLSRSMSGYAEWIERLLAAS